jgi:lysophospholipase L1-like esterase
MNDRRLKRRRAAVVAAVLMWSGPAVAEPAGNGITSCATPPSLSTIEAILDRSAVRVERGEPLTIVAMGSSSTQGAGASAPAMSYPSRLERELKDRFPAVEIRVLNRGVGGQDVGEEILRLGKDVIAEHPDLVIWQVGTNAVLRRDSLDADQKLISRGVELMKEEGVDLVLMDLQYAPRVLARPAWEEMERIIEDIAHRAHVGLFHRFQIMQQWDRRQQLAPAAMIGPDGLHMTDASYACLASELAEALARSWWSHSLLAKGSARGAVARLDRAGNAAVAGNPRQH